MTEKWYSSGLGVGAGLGIFVFMAFVGYGQYRKLESQNILEPLNRVNKANKPYSMQFVLERDLNGNGKPERFTEIDGVKYFSTIDGTNLEKSLKH